MMEEYDYLVSNSVDKWSRLGSPFQASHGCSSTSLVSGISKVHRGLLNGSLYLLVIKDEAQIVRI